MDDFFLDFFSQMVYIQACSFTFESAIDQKKEENPMKKTIVGETYFFIHVFLMVEGKRNIIRFKKQVDRDLMGVDLGDELEEDVTLPDSCGLVVYKVEQSQQFNFNVYMAKHEYNVFYQLAELTSPVKTSKLRLRREHDYIVKSLRKLKNEEEFKRIQKDLIQAGFEQDRKG